MKAESDRRSRTKKLCGPAAVAMAVLLGGCTHVQKATPDEVRVDTEWLGVMIPGIVGWRGWFRANEHCAAYGRKPELVDLHGSIAVYRCVAAKKSEAAPRG
jgi:hypothetical protein